MLRRRSPSKALAARCIAAAPQPSSCWHAVGDGGPARKGRVPTAGLVAIAAALNLCANVSIFGFGDELGIPGNASKRCAYYFTCSGTEDAYAKGSSLAHDLAHQRRVLALLESSHAITRFAS